MQKSTIRKSLVVGIIFLFIGVGVLSSVSSKNISVSNNVMLNYDNELEDFNSVEIPFQIYGIDGIESYTITVTINQKDELDAFVDTFKQELDNAETHEETITIFNNAIVTLDEIGIIPKEIKINELKTQITENIQFSYRKNYEFTETYLNNNCLIIGRSYNTFGENYRILSLLFPVWIAFGWWYNIWNENLPAEGWIYTSGENGDWYYEGTFYGTLGTEVDPFFNELYVGARGFRGIKLGDSITIYIGFAESVGIDTNLP